MQSPDLLFAPFVSGHCIGDERSSFRPLLYLWISDTATFGIMEFGSYGQADQEGVLSLCMTTLL